MWKLCSVIPNKKKIDIWQNLNHLVVQKQLPVVSVFAVGFVLFTDECLDAGEETTT
jgi:hypothetical protein